MGASVLSAFSRCICPGSVPSILVPGYAGSLAGVAVVWAVSIRHFTQHGEAFGHQISIRVKCDRHGGEDGLRQEEVFALDIPEGLCDIGPQLLGAGQRLMRQCRQVRTDVQGDIDPCESRTRGESLWLICSP